jgi:hypothetical protein
LMQGYLDRTMRLARQLGARRFEAQGIEMQARVLLDTRRRAEAAESYARRWRFVGKPERSSAGQRSSAP